MGTPDEKLWPGVTSLPDYKTNFPLWAPKDINKMVPNLSKDDKDPLKVMCSERNYTGEGQIQPRNAEKSS